MASKGQQEALVERLHWLVRLRWIAVGGVFLTVLFTSGTLPHPPPAFPLYAISVLFGAYNLIFRRRLRNLKADVAFAAVNRMANAQITFDLLSLGLLLHYAGGVENPFVFYFVFHTIIASILLSRRAAFLQATFALFLFLAIVTAEYLGILPHYCLRDFIVHDQHNNLIYIAGIAFVLLSTLYIAAYLATSISKKLRQREENLEETTELLREKDRIKSQYVMRVSHDIKEHLAAIQGCLEPVASGITGELNLQQSDMVGRAVRRTAKLILFVKALLEITRIKLGKELKMDYFSIEEAVGEAVSQIALKAANKGIPVNLTVEPGVNRIHGAQEYIQETLVNLLANAVKYTPANGRIDIHVGDKGEAVLMRIADNGIGIPKDELPRIFEEFYRASNAKEVERDGTGLGLAIARQIIERHNGRIWVESELGKGSVFQIELPK